MTKTTTGQSKARLHHQCVLHGTPVLFCKEGSNHDRYECMFIKCRQWLDTCLAGHPGAWFPPSGCPCNTPLGPTQFHSICPSRLIDVGVNGESPRLIKFNNLDEVKEASTSARYPGYVTLSYCWGTKNDHGHLLREETEVQFLQALPPLPRTIQDAVDVCRRIGIRYLWVDAICIIQGRGGASSDWEKESARVGSYYANSMFTIAVTWAKASDEGCLPRKPYYYYMKWIASVPHTVRHGHVRRLASDQWSDVAGDFNGKSILKTRGWTTQELSLSARTLWLSPLGAVFSCRKEDRGYWGKKANYNGTIAQFQRNMRSGWNELLWRYTITELSYADDKLPALSGICKYIDPDATDQYLAGIWLSSLSRSLFWRPDDIFGTTTTPARDTSLPSWSPLAPACRITYESNWVGDCEADEACAKCGPGRLRFHRSVVKLRYADIHGCIDSAVLEVDATLYPGKVIPDGATRSGPSGKLHLAERVVLGGTLYTDERKPYQQKDTKQPESALEVYAILLSHSGYEDYDEERLYLQFLLLNRAAEPNSYRRVGCFSSWTIHGSTAHFLRNPSSVSRILLV